MGKGRDKFVSDSISGLEFPRLDLGIRDDFLSGPEPRKNRGRKRSSTSFGHRRSRRSYRPRMRPAKPLSPFEAKVFSIFFVIAGTMIIWYVAPEQRWILILLGVLFLAIFLLWVRKKSSILKGWFMTWKGDDPLSPIVAALREMDVQPVRSEEDFEKQVLQWLRGKGFRVERQVRNGKRQFDLVIDGWIAVELKTSERAKQLEALIGQVKMYQPFYRKLLVLILDSGHVRDIDLYAREIRDIAPEKVRVEVLKGDVRRLGKRKEYVLMRN